MVSFKMICMHKRKTLSNSQGLRDEREGAYSIGKHFVNRLPGAPKPAHLPAGIGAAGGNIPVHDGCNFEWLVESVKRKRKSAEENQKVGAQDSLVNDKVKAEKSAGTFCQTRAV